MQVEVFSVTYESAVITCCVEIYIETYTGYNKIIFYVK